MKSFRELLVEISKPRPPFNSPVRGRDQTKFNSVTLRHIKNYLSARLDQLSNHNDQIEITPIDLINRRSNREHTITGLKNVHGKVHAIVGDQTIDLNQFSKPGIFTSQGDIYQKELTEYLHHWGHADKNVKSSFNSGLDITNTRIDIVHPKNIKYYKTDNLLWSEEPSRQPSDVITSTASEAKINSKSTASGQVVLHHNGSGWEMTDKNHPFYSYLQTAKINNGQNFLDEINKTYKPEKDILGIRPQLNSDVMPSGKIIHDYYVKNNHLIHYGNQMFVVYHPEMQKFKDTCVDTDCGKYDEHIKTYEKLKKALGKEPPLLYESFHATLRTRIKNKQAGNVDVSVHTEQIKAGIDITNHAIMQRWAQVAGTFKGSDAEDHFTERTRAGTVGNSSDYVDSTAPDHPSKYK